MKKFIQSLMNPISNSKLFLAAGVVSTSLLLISIYQQSDGDESLFVIFSQNINKFQFIFILPALLFAVGYYFEEKAQKYARYMAAFSVAKIAAGDAKDSLKKNEEQLTFALRYFHPEKWRKSLDLTMAELEDLDFLVGRFAYPGASYRDKDGTYVSGDNSISINFPKRELHKWRSNKLEAQKYFEFGKTAFRFLIMVDVVAVITWVAVAFSA